MIARTLGLLALFLTSACASITAGTSQSVAVDSSPTQGAQCELSNEKGKWTIPTTPGTTTVNKANGDLTVTCTHPDGGKGVTTVQSSTAGAAFGNILAGGIIGAAVDMGSGAAYIYPAQIHVPLSPPPAPAPTTPTPVAITEPRLSKSEGEAALRQLSALRNKRLIPEEEYQARVHAVMDRMS